MFSSTVLPVSGRAVEWAILHRRVSGTGKTLIARALANECTFGCRKVSFFMRKGADLLSKWIGESEKQLRLLFEQVRKAT